ncbi:MAG: hypothetical protein R2751_07645 [Bacteroidales bacterium]
MHLIAGIWPLVSLRNAEFMKNEVPGVYVPDELIREIGRFESKEDQLKAGVDIARRMVDRVLPCPGPPGERTLRPLWTGRGWPAPS